MLQVSSLWNSVEEFDTMPYRKLLVQVEKVDITTRIIKGWGFPYREGNNTKRHPVGMWLVDSTEVLEARLECIFWLTILA